MMSQRGLRSRDVYPRDGRVCSSGDSLVVLGSDGAARMYSTTDSIGEILGTNSVNVRSDTIRYLALVQSLLMNINNYDNINNNNDNNNLPTT